MPVNIEDNELLLRCACHTTEHLAFLIHEPDDSRGNNLKGVDDDWYLSVMLCHYGFWKRVGKAFQYVFWPRSIKYGMTSEIILRSEDVDRLAEFIQKRRRTLPKSRDVDGQESGFLG